MSECLAFEGQIRVVLSRARRCYRTGSVNREDSSALVLQATIDDDCDCAVVLKTSLDSERHTPIDTRLLPLAHSLSPGTGQDL